MPASAEPLGVYVLGMHRSGTSAITRVIDLLGVSVATHGLLPGNPFNPPGYWEVRGLMQLNDRLLERLGSSWHTPPPLETLSGADRLLQSALGPAEQEFRGFHPGSQWVWKDPRNCLLFGFWRAALAEPAVVVFVHREPAEIIASLGGYGMTAAKAAALWERYVRCARLLAGGVPSVVVDYGRLVEAPEEEVEQLARFLGAHGARLDPDGRPPAAQSIQAELRRQRVDLPRSALTPEQAAMASMLEEAAGARAPLSAVEPPPETRASWRLLTPSVD